MKVIVLLRHVRINGNEPHASKVLDVFEVSDDAERRISAENENRDMTDLAYQANLNVWHTVEEHEVVRKGKERSDAK